MSAKRDNAPMDWTPTGAAQVCDCDSSTIADDMRFAWRALGVADMLAPLREPRALLAALGGGLVLLGAMLELSILA